MTEVAFPLLGAAFVVLVVLPLFALAAKAGLVLLEREEAGGPLHGLHLRYILLTGSSALPLAWFFSAGVHQAETGGSIPSCLTDHDAAASCFEPEFFAATLAAAVLALSVRVVRQQRGVSASTSDADAALVRRLDRIVARTSALADLRNRLVVVDTAGFALGTYGLLQPRVFVGAAFAGTLSDEMLASALGHEREHVRGLDPLRYLLLQLALAVNPVGRLLLDPHASRWRAAREAHCDRAAVIDGAAPLPLADAIVRAARPTPREIVALGTGDTAVLKLRVGMLLAFAEEPPDRCCHRGPSVFPVALLLLVFVLLLPHQVGTAPLDALHTGTEHTLAYFWR